MLESFILCRYLYNNKEQTDDVWIGRKVDVDGKKRFIRIKDMFNEISPGYYDKYYGQQLSGMAHGKIAAHLFRVKRSSPTNGIVISVPEYNEDDATFIVNYTNALMYGYFNYFPKFFSDGFTTILQNVMSEYDYAKVWLESSMGKHKQANPESEKWYTHMDKIIL